MRSMFTAGLVMLLVAGLGCGGGAESESAGSEATATRQPEAKPPVASPPARVEVEEPTGLCDLIEREEVAGAFRGKLPLGEMHNVKGGCVIDVLLGDREGNAVRYTPLSIPNYEAYKKYEAQPDVTFEWLEGLGKEAFVINHNQIQILTEQNDAIMIALQLVLRGLPMPLTPEEIQDGVVSLAHLLLSKGQP